MKSGVGCLGSPMCRLIGFNCGFGVTAPVSDASFWNG